MVRTTPRFCKSPNAARLVTSVVVMPPIFLTCLKAADSFWKLKKRNLKYQKLKKVVNELELSLK